MLKMNNKKILIMGILIMILFSSALVSAVVCCEKLLKDGQWCQEATKTSECNLTAGFNYRSPFQHCDNEGKVPFCSGTCVDKETGECSNGQTPEKECKEDGGKWYAKSVGIPDECKPICCIIKEIKEQGQWISPKECDQKALEFPPGVVEKVPMDSREACEGEIDRIFNEEYGACVISTEEENSCKMTTRGICNDGDINSFKDNMKYPDRVIGLETDFIGVGILCTAIINGQNISECLPTNHTTCEENKIYYWDDCNNRANIYDTTLFFVKGNRTRENYWTNLKKWEDPTICNVSSRGSASCGNCNTADNTVCGNYKQTTQFNRPLTTINPDGNVCRSMTCEYDFNGNNEIDNGETREHGESWCAGVSGAVTSGILIIDRNSTTKSYNKEDIETLKNSSKYNIPGSKYYKLRCDDGEVVVEEGKDYRNEVCVQEINYDTGRTTAFFVQNSWNLCTLIDSRTSCENNKSLCKWIPGYRFDWAIANETMRKEFQGSCVSLIAPGFDFWKPTSKGNAICQMASLQDSALFETPWTVKRSNLKDWNPLELSHRCINGCYTIPFYGLQFNQIISSTGAVEEKKYPDEVFCGTLPTLICGPSSPCPAGFGFSCVNGHCRHVCTVYETLTQFYDESEYQLSSSVSNYFLSTRRGQYCHQDNDESQWLTGTVVGRAYDCTPLGGSEAKDERKERDYPIYLTNDEWIRSITDRAHSIGDCGYKMNINGQYNSNGSEKITAVFQKLKQDMTNKGIATVEQIIWKGGRYLDKENLEKYETELGTTTTAPGTTPETTYTCPALTPNAGTCLPTSYIKEPCKAEQGGTVNTEATCPANNVCCVYTDIPES
jgi:hypothetical protein